MCKKLKFAFTLMLLTGLSAVVFPQNKPIITILDFKGSNIAESEIFVFVDYITSIVVDAGKYRVIDRSQRETLLKEIEFSLSGCTDEACQLEIGRLLSAKYIIIGSLGTIGSRYILNMKMIDIETSETIASASERYVSLDALIDDAERVVAGFIGGEFEKSKPVIAEKPDQTAPGDQEGETRRVELVPAPTRDDLYPERDYKRHGLEVAVGYADSPVVTCYGGYTFSFSKKLAVGLILGFYVYEEYDSYWGTTESYTDPLSGAKVIFGDKANGAALSLGVVVLSDYNLPFIGFYYKRLFGDLSYDPDADAPYFDLGYAISF